MAPLFIGELFIEFVGSVLKDLGQDAIGYDKCRFSRRTTLEPAEVLEQLTLLADGTPFSAELTPDSVIISTGGIWSPTFRGTLEATDEGSILSGTFSTGMGAVISLFIAVFVLLGMCLLAVLTTWAGPTICIAFMVVSFWIVGVGFVVRKHKSNTIPHFKSQISTRLK